MKRIYVDTNVFLDFVFHRDPFYEDAKRVLALANDDDKEVYISALTLVNGVYLSRKYKYAEDEMRSTYLQLVRFIHVVDLTKENVVGSLTRGWRDYEDCTQHQCALDIDADCIVTRNVKDYRLSSIPVYEAHDYLREGR